MTKEKSKINTKTDQADKKRRTITKIIYNGIVFFASIILTIFSMEAIKNVPGNSFSTEMDFIATTLLVFVLWFLAIKLCIWLIGFLVNLNKLKRSSSNKNVSTIIEKKNKDLKTLSTLEKIIIGILNVTCIYFIIIFSTGAGIFFGFGIPVGIYFVLISADFCLILLLLICAIFDLVTMIKLKRNPRDKKVTNIRKKTKKYFKILIVLCVCFPILMYLCVLLFNH